MSAVTDAPRRAVPPGGAVGRSAVFISPRIRDRRPNASKEQVK